MRSLHHLSRMAVIASAITIAVVCLVQTTYATPMTESAKPLDFGPDVLKRDASNFNETIAANPTVVAIFTLDTCPHCQNIIPEFAAAAKELAPYNVVAVQVDANANREMSARLGVAGFPTIMHFFNGVKVSYHGERNKASLIRYTLDNMGRFVRNLEVESTPELDALASQSIEVGSDDQVERPLTPYANALLQAQLKDAAYNYLVLGIFAEDSTNPQVELFETATQHVRSYLNGGAWRYVNTQRAHLLGLSKPGDEGIVAVRVAPGYEAITVRFTGESNSEAFETWIRQHAVPTVVNFRTDLNRLWSNDEIPRIKYFVNYPNTTAAEREAFTANLKAIAQKYRGQIYIGLIDASQHQFQFQANYYGFQGEPFVALESMAKRKRYRTFDASVEGLSKFIDSYFDGTIPDFIRSQPAPADPYMGPYIRAVGETFSSFVKDDVNAFVMLYAPWCGHSKAAFPEFRKVAQKFKDEGRDVAFVVMDATANDWPRASFKLKHGYPSFYFKPAHATVAQEFMRPDARTAVEFENFILETLEAQQGGRRNEL